MFNKKDTLTCNCLTSTRPARFLKKSKKGIGPVVAIALLIVVSVAAVIGFQNWFGTYSQDIFNQAEINSRDSSSLDSIETIVGNQLYFRASENISVKKVLIEGNDCQININVSGVQNISLGSCLEGLSTNSPEVVVVLDDKILTKKIYLGNNILSSQDSVVNSFFYSLKENISNVDASFYGEASSDQAGSSLAGVGDVNGDGFDDFIVGAFANEEVGFMGGQTYLILGKSSGWNQNVNLFFSDASFLAESSWDRAGRGLAGIGDVNSDGFDDFLISSYTNSESYLILGRSSGWSMDTSLSLANASFLGENSNDYIGKSSDGVGDVNGDGFDDFIIGGPRNDEGISNRGQTYLILGRSNGWSMDTSLSLANASFLGEASNDYSGDSVSGVGDVNGDSFDDFIIAAADNSESGSSAGQVYLILGRSSGWSMDTPLSLANASFLGEFASDSLGSSVSGVGDVNNDGFDDFVISAIYSSGGRGQTYLILGRSNGWSMDMSISLADASFLGETSSDYSGNSVSGVGDVNNDGFDDFIIASTENSETGFIAGQVYLILGRSSGWSQNVNLSMSDASFLGEFDSDQLGSSLEGIGDVNNDGFDDFVIGAWGNDYGGSESGKAYLILGN